MRHTASSPVETKVALPAVVVAILILLVPALYAMARAYGFNPSDDQNLALIGLGVALQYAAHVTLGYWAPHTPRADVDAGH